MPTRTITFKMIYYTETAEDQKLVIDAVVGSVCDARSVAQTIIMTSPDKLPAPHVELSGQDLDGVPIEIDPEEWQRLRMEEQAEEDANG